MYRLCKVLWKLRRGFNRFYGGRQTFGRALYSKVASRACGQEA